MNINDVTARKEYVGNGVTTIFAYDFGIVSTSDIEVIVGGVVQTLGTHYSVSGAGVDAGGNVTFATAPSNSINVILLRKQPFSQLSVYQSNEDFPAKRLETDLSKLAMITQQIRESERRSFKANKDNIIPSEVTIDFVANANKFVKINPTGTGLEAQSFSLIGGIGLPVMPLDGGLGFNNFIGSTKAGLPANGSVGKIVRVTNDVKGLWMDDGSTWRHIAPQQVGNTAEWDITGLRILGIGPHAIGQAINLGYQVVIGGTWTPQNGGQGAGLLVTSGVIAQINQNAYITLISSPTGITKAGSGTHPSFATLTVDDIIINAGAAALTNAYPLIVSGTVTGGSPVNKGAAWFGGMGGVRVDSDGTLGELRLNRAVAGPAAQMSFERSLVAKASLGLASANDLVFFDSASSEVMRLLTSTSPIGALVLKTTDFTSMAAGDFRMNGSLWIADGVTAPTARTGFMVFYVDTADGDLKVKFGDGVTKTITVDT